MKGPKELPPQTNEGVHRIFRKGFVWCERDDGVYSWVKTPPNRWWFLRMHAWDFVNRRDRTYSPAVLCYRLGGKFFMNGQEMSPQPEPVGEK